jgi:uncharacterized protein YkwD
MKNKLFLFVFLLAISQNTYSQIAAETENRPQAYLFSSGDKTVGSGKKPVDSATVRPQAYLFSSGTLDRNIAERPRIVQTTQKNPAENDYSKTDPNVSLEKQAFELINQQRAKMNLLPLVWSDEVANIARKHSKDMATFNFFSHTDLNGLMVNDRADIFGVSKWQAIGENIAYNRGYNNPVEFAVERWMLSPSHRENLLNSRWKESGIGIAVTDNGTYYFTEVFLLRK